LAHEEGGKRTNTLTSRLQTSPHLRLTGLRPRSPDTFFNVVCAEELGHDEAQTELAIEALLGHRHHPGQAEILRGVKELD
jgi:hypothetical protein